ncbi:DeoR/GlpR family DNA-binding transcription regulator [Ligilactobacillus pobuzihii]|uniref:Lactose phosphotransferase system repressor n=1 Tax=Ligilactobacillus pobuzihii TaxID=449659 RepID=A0A0R2LA57_9LACO|nr:DeoR/GlpR family DNA-binding transcription regulator [Ligilactobacillus pobuzihii]KRK10432.1 lactose phosphotransferase system repressor [Ligilactobacillus pobuzihii E100301 = KCTC 13174]KRN98635.1 lactose phosphotransferase system repressor [Ligilactobacillus pobuzihii]GEN47565.1 DeoR family transcriptional regulator [Ligilactobacillus pobuzihii]
MLKKERLMMLLDMVNQNSIMTVNDLIGKLGVSDMTIRRDLDELADSGKLVRIHGGAQSVASSDATELSHIEKKELHLEQKEQIAQRAAKMINAGDTIYIGPGTTQELIVHYVDDIADLRVVTNSLPVFECWQNKNVDLILVGGNFRERSGAFIGGLASDTLRDLKFNKSFVGVNGLHNESMMTANTEEGSAQAIAVNNSLTKIVLADRFKINRDDFYQFYNLYDVDYLITNDELNDETVSHYQQYTKVILAKE